jgi:hypothetical protein
MALLHSSIAYGQAILLPTKPRSQQEYRFLFARKAEVIVFPEKQLAYSSYLYQLQV